MTCRRRAGAAAAVALAAALALPACSSGGGSDRSGAGAGTTSPLAGPGGIPSPGGTGGPGGGTGGTGGAVGSGPGGTGGQGAAGQGAPGQGAGRQGAGGQGAPGGPAGGTGAGAAPAALSREAYLAQAGDRCRQAGAQVAILAGVPDRLAALEAELAVLDQLVADLRGLRPPAAEAGAVAGLIDGQAALNGLLRQALAALQAGDIAGAEGLRPRIDATGAAVDAAWDAYGLPACGSGFGF